MKTTARQVTHLVPRTGRHPDLRELKTICCGQPVWKLMDAPRVNFYTEDHYDVTCDRRKP